MKKLLAMVLALMMVFSLTALASAEESDMAYIKEKGKLTVGMTLFAPMNYYESWALKWNSSRSAGTPRKSS